VNAEKEDAKLKASPCDPTEKSKEKSSSDPEKELKGNPGEEGRPKRRNSPRGGREEADNHAKEARSTRKADNHAKEARSTRRAGNIAQEGLYTTPAGQTATVATTALGRGSGAVSLHKTREESGSMRIQSRTWIRIQTLIRAHGDT
jgi:hypothetical protein